MKPFFALFVVVRTKFFVQNKRSFFHRIPLFGSLDCDMCHFSLFPVSEIQNFPYFSCKIWKDVQNQLETLLPQWYNYIVILWKLGAKPRADRPQALTANAFLEDMQKSKEAGMDAHLSKPVDIAALEQTVKRFRVTPPN